MPPTLEGGTDGGEGDRRREGGRAPQQQGNKINSYLLMRSVCGAMVQAADCGPTLWGDPVRAPCLPLVSRRRALCANTGGSCSLQGGVSVVKGEGS